MYMSEGLLPKGGDKAITVPDNVECLKLLMGVTSPTKQLGVLDVIVDEGHAPGASDTKMNKALHSRFGGNKEFFPRVHPKDIDHQFKVKHFPGVVT
jgi:myosin heavy subunit